MSNNNFDKAFDLVVGVEGGYVNDPRDPGGRTIYGITERDHPDLWRAGPPTLAQAKARYKRDYWDAVRGDELPWPLSLFVFDAAVNQGVDAAIRVLQKTAVVAIDGKLGPKTLAAARALSREGQALYLADRALRYTGTRNFDRFGRGWLKRLFLLAFEV